jgi:hypothetical protein
MIPLPYILVGWSNYCVKTFFNIFLFACKGVTVLSCNWSVPVHVLNYCRCTGTISVLWPEPWWQPLPHIRRHVSIQNWTCIELLQVYLFFYLRTGSRYRTEHVPIELLQVYLFYDLSPGGSLCHIFAAMYRYKTEQGWRRCVYLSIFQSVKIQKLFLLEVSSQIFSRQVVDCRA